MIETATSYPAIDTQTTVADLARSLQSALDMNSAQQRIINEQKNKIDNARLAILEAFDNESFDRENFEVVAEALEIELTKEYQVTISVTFSGTVTLPLGTDVDEIENYVDFDAEANRYKDDVEVDLFVDGVDVRVSDR